MVSVYAGDTVSKGSDALFDPRAGCEPLRSPLLPRADVPLRGARAKNRGPLQAVRVMAGAMAERLGYVVPCQSKPLGATVTVWRWPCNDPIHALAVRLLRLQPEPELLAHHGGKKPPHRMRLPAGGMHDRRDGGAARPAQQSQHPRLLRLRSRL